MLRDGTASVVCLVKEDSLWDVGVGVLLSLSWVALVLSFATGWPVKRCRGFKKKKEQYTFLLTSVLAIRYAPNFLHKPARKKAEGSEASS